MTLIYDEHHSTSILEGKRTPCDARYSSTSSDHTEKLGVKIHGFLRFESNPFPLFLRDTLLALYLAFSSNKLSSSSHLQYNDDRFKGSKIRNKGKMRRQRAQRNLGFSSVQVSPQFKGKCRHYRNNDLGLSVFSHASYL